MTESKNFDVIIIGGSYAGLSAALALGRSMRHVLIIDSGLPCNRQTPQSHNFITHDGEKPSAIAEKAKAQVLNYSTVKLYNGLAISGKKTENIFVIRVENNKAAWINVKPGREANGKIEIHGNLNAGDLILKTANDEVRNGSELQNLKTVTL